MRRWPPSGRLGILNHMDDPEAVAPPFAQTGTESEISLYSGPLDIVSSTRSEATGQGTIRLRVRPTPQLAVHAFVDARIDTGDGCRVSFATGVCDLSVSQTRSSSSGVEVKGRLTSPLVRVLQAEGRAVEVRAELINFPIVAGSTAGRLVWTADGFEFTLDRMPGAREAECLLKDGAGYALTHVIAIRRQDANPIRVADFEAIADTLYDALSFYAGSYVGIACAAGLDSAGARVWESWAVARTQFWLNRISWPVPAKAATSPGVLAPSATAGGRDAADHGPVAP